MKLLINSPAPINSTTASAISATTSADRIHCPPMLAPPRVLSRKALGRRAPVSWSAGNIPNATLVAIAIANVTMTTAPFTPTSSSRGMSAGCAATSARVATNAIARPSTAPAAPRTTASVSS